jgi:hypothetical protein
MNIIGSRVTMAAAIFIAFAGAARAQSKDTVSPRELQAKID